MVANKRAPSTAMQCAALLLLAFCLSNRIVPLRRPELEGVDPIDHLFSLTEGHSERDHVYTLHAELEGNTYLEAFERLTGHAFP